MDDQKETGRQAHILETALKVFARHGFKKTSMEDLARAAQLSRQSMYLHFKNKEDVFKATIQKALDESLAAAGKALNKEDRPLEERLLGALDEWFGRYVGVFHVEANDVGQQARLMLGTAVEDSGAVFQKQMIKVIAASSSKKSKAQQVQLATEIAQILCACGFTWKHDLTSREAFLDRMKAAIRICCQDI